MYPTGGPVHRAGRERIVAMYRFEFDQAVPLEEVEMTLHLAMYAVEGLYGSARVRLEAGYHLDAPRRVMLVDGTTEVGSTVVRVFTALALREFGEDAFSVRRVEAHSAPAEGRAA